MKTSVIITTYNKPKLLGLVLESLKRQTKSEFELVIADDGSSDDTRLLVEKEKKEFYGDRLIHVWQPDKGFRAAASRNNAIRKSTGEYLIFLDGDCLTQPTFVENHIKLSEEGYFVTGNRVLLSPDLSKEIINNGYDPTSKSIIDWMALVASKKMNRFHTLLSLPLPPLFRKLRPRDWKKLRSCNFSIWRKDIEQINGFDEDFTGWGFEDSDLAVRLINNGIKRKSGNFSTTVFHVYHPEQKQPQSGPSWDILQRRIINKESMAPHGLKMLDVDQKKSIPAKKTEKDDLSNEE